MEKRMEEGEGVSRRRRFVLALLGIMGIASLGVAGTGGERAFEFTAGDIVGIYWDATRGGYSGFLQRNGEFTPINFPGALHTDARSINPAGDIVGRYVLPGETGPLMHGYLLTRHGEFRNVDVPGRRATLAQGILPNGTILGCSHDNDMTGSMFAFVRDPDGVLSETPMAGTMNYGATPGLGMIVGRWINPLTLEHWGLLQDDTGLNTFRVPGSTFTQAWGINPRGEVVGHYIKDGVRHGFVKDGDTFTAVTYPGAAATFALGINASGDVVGSFVVNGRYHAFVATLKPGK
jgi:uncharacterized membrane protein